MTRETLTLNQWPGPPRFLPPPMLDAARVDKYVTAANFHATKEQLRVVFEDIGVRLAAMEAEEAS